MNKTRRNIIIIALAALVIIVGGVGAYLVFSRTPEERAALYMESGKEYFEKGQYVKASLDVRNALQLNDRIVEGWYLLSKISQKQNNFRAAYQLLQKTIQLDPSHVAAHIDLGKILLAGKQLDRALKQSDTALKLEPNSARSHAFRAGVLFSLSDINGAAAEAKTALEIDPKNLDAIVVSATTRIRQGKIDEAMGFIDEGLKIAPSEAALHFLKISTDEKNNRIDDAIAAYKVAIAQSDTPNNFRRGLVNLYLKTKKTDEAEAVYREIIKSDPENTNYVTEFIGFLRRVRGPEAAEKALLEFIKSRPDQPELRFALATFYVIEKKLDKAKETYEKLIADYKSGPNELSAKAKLAALAVSERDDAKAEKLIAEILQVEPRNPEALFIRARLRLRDFRTEEAIADLRTIIRDAPDNASALLYLARAHVQAGAYELAAERYVQAYAKNPERNDIRVEYANFLVNRGEYAQADEVLEAALALEPKYVPALQLMTRVKLARRDWAGAQEIAERMEQATGNPIFAEEIKGAVYRAQKDIDASIDAFRRAHEIAPTAPRPVVALVETYLQSGKRKEAKDFVDAIIRADDRNVLAYFLRGQILATDGDSKGAEQAFRKVIEIDPKSPAGYRGLSSLYMMNKDPASAEAALKEGIQAVPDNNSIRLALGTIYEYQKRYDDAIDIYQEIVDDSPRQIVAINNLASLISDHRTDKESLEKALKLAERLRGTQFPYFSDTLGWIYYRLNKPDRAVKLIKTAVDAVPNVPIFHYHLAMVYLAVGNRDSAKTEFQKTLELGGDSFDQKDKVKAELEKL